MGSACPWGALLGRKRFWRGARGTISRGNCLKKGGPLKCLALNRCKGQWKGSADMYQRHGKQRA
eukprot:1140878-Pelagomonas_calceolata.AAC.5